MYKELHAIEFDGVTFGTAVNASSGAYKKFLKQIKEEEAISYFGDKFTTLTVSAVWLGAIMGEAHWIVTEAHYIDKFMIEGLKKDEYIYVKYDDEPLDIKKRMQKEWEHIYNYTRRK